MHVDVERRPGGQVALTITVEPALLTERMEQLFQKFARRVNVAGFRPGKAPRQLVEARLDRDMLLRDAVDSVIESTYKEALREQQIEPLERAEVEEVTTGDDLTLTYRAVVAVRPLIILPELSGLEVDYTSTRVTGEQIETEIERLRKGDAEIVELTDAPVETGDLVTIDSKAQIDGAPYAEGDLAGYPLEVGADTFFTELNEGLLGMTVGETRMITKSYPEEFAQPALAGKTVEYAVTITQIRRTQLPDVTDAWVAAKTNGNLQTVDELNERLRSNMEGMANQMDHDQIRETLVRQVVAQAELEIPDVMVDEEHEHLMHRLEEQLSREYLTLEEYAENIQRSVTDIKNEQMVMARDVVRRSMVLQEVARRGHITVTDEDIDTLLIMESYQRGERDMKAIRRQLKSQRKEMSQSGRLDYIVNRLYQEKILRYLEQEARVTIDGKPLQRETTAAAPADEQGTSPAVDEQQG